MDLKFIRTLEMRATAPGVDDASAKLNKLQAAHEGVAKSATTTAMVTDRAAKSQLSLAAEVEKLERRFNPVIRAQQEFEKVERRLMAAAAAHPDIQGRANTVIAQAAQHYDRMAVSATESAKSLNVNVAASKLSRYELINLSRQVQDVGVSLASGQSPLMVLVQQGTQIADVFASSQTKMTDVFKSGIAWAGRFAMSTTGILSGIAAVGGTALFAASQFGSAQREIAVSLAGIGRGSGAAVNDILKIGAAASSINGLSVSEAREFAATLAATGKIGVDNITEITKSAKDFATTLNVDVTEAAKILATAFADPGKGVDILAARLGGINDFTRENIKLLAEQQQRGAAQKALVDATVPSLMKAAAATGFWGTSWTAVSNVASNAWSALGEGIANITGIGQSQQSQLEGLQQKYANLAKTIEGASPTWPLLSRAQTDLQNIGQQIAKLQTQTQNADLLGNVEELNKLSKVGGDLARAWDPAEAKLRELNATLAIFSKLLGDPNAAMLVKDLEGMSRAAEATREQIEAVNRAKAAAPGMSTGGAIDLSGLRDQLTIAQAVTGEERLRAQEIARTNQLILEQKGSYEATVRAAAEHAVAQAQINTAAQQNLLAMKDQFAVASAVTGEQRIMAEGQAAYNALIRQGVDARLAAATAAQQEANALAQVNAAAQQSLLALENQQAAAGAVTNAQKIQAQEQATINTLILQGVDAELAMAAASQQTANAIESANASVANQTHAIQQQTEMMIARQNGTEATTAAAQAYENAIRSGADETEAAALKAAVLANEMAKAAANAERMTQQINDAEDKLNADLKKSQEEGGAGGKGYLKGGGSPGLGYSMNSTGKGYASPTTHLTIAGPGGIRTTPIESRAGGYALPGYENSPTGHLYQKIDEVLSGGGSLADAIAEIKGMVGRTRDFDLAMQGVISDLTERMAEENPAIAVELLQEQLNELQKLPRTLERDDQMRGLKDQLKQLTEATDALNETMIGLSDIYTQGHSALRIGYTTEGGSRYDGPGSSRAGQPIGPLQVPAPMPVPPLGMPAPWNSFTDAPIVPGAPQYMGGSIVGPGSPYFNNGQPLPAGQKWDPRSFSLHAAEGIQGIVGGSGGTDSQEINLRATPGELLTVQTPQQQRESQGDDNRVTDNSRIVNINIPTEAPSGRRRSWRQTAEAYSRVVG